VTLCNEMREDETSWNGLCRWTGSFDMVPAYLQYYQKWQSITELLDF
jgi:hypothetical protein